MYITCLHSVQLNISSFSFLLTGAIHLISFFFFNDTATTEIYTLSLHDALPICPGCLGIAQAYALFMGRRSQRSTGKKALDRKSTRLNSSHLGISYAVFCLKKKKEETVEWTVVHIDRTADADVSLVERTARALGL